MLDFIERFFKLTLDNVYRFACSLIFVLSLVGLWSHKQPLAVFQELVSWLGFRSSSWIAAVAAWIDVRAAVIGLLASLMLLVSLAFAAANRLGGRAGATAILMVAVMIQTDTFWKILPFYAAAIALFLVLPSIFGWLLNKKFHWGFPTTLASGWAGLGHTLAAVFVAALWLLSPLGWLISAAQDERSDRGTFNNPIHVKHVRGPYETARQLTPHG